jgi:hypothetical protein
MAAHDCTNYDENDTPQITDNQCPAIAAKQKTMASGLRYTSHTRTHTACTHTYTPLNTYGNEGNMGAGKPAVAECRHPEQSSKFTSSLTVTPKITRTKSHLFCSASCDPFGGCCCCCCCDCGCPAGHADEGSSPFLLTSPCKDAEGEVEGCCCCCQPLLAGPLGLVLSALAKGMLAEGGEFFCRREGGEEG